MDKFQNKYRIASARLQTWDYCGNGTYFITICTKDRAHYFGRVVLSENGIGKMQLSEIGKFAETSWMEIPQHFPFVTLGNFVIMPDHMHGILIFDGGDVGDGGIIDTGGINNAETPKLGVSTAGKNENWKSNSVGSIINSYKRIITINARKICSDFGWQSRFYDHVIRDGVAFENIQKYIANNASIASARLQTWDFSRDGAYFIRICTKDRVDYFGRVYYSN
jgi:putative transposase